MVLDECQIVESLVEPELGFRSYHRQVGSMDFFRLLFATSRLAELNHSQRQGIASLCNHPKAFLRPESSENRSEMAAVFWC